MLSRVRLFVTAWTRAHQAPLSITFSRQEYWSGLPFPLGEPARIPQQQHTGHLLVPPQGGHNPGLHMPFVFMLLLCFYVGIWGGCFLFGFCLEFVLFVVLMLLSVQFSSVAQSCLTLCDPMDCSLPGLPVHTNSRCCLFHQEKTVPPFVRQQFILHPQHC